MSNTNAVFSTLLLLTTLLCAAPHCSAAGGDLIVNKGLKPISYQAALKQSRSPVLLPTGWRKENCVFYVNWVKEKKLTDNGRTIDLPARKAIAVALKGSSKRLIVEAPYIKSLSADENVKGVLWIAFDGYFVKPSIAMFAVVSLGHLGRTSYAIMGSECDQSNSERFEKSLR